jgi:MOSC domain-containing protein YiiM
MSEMTGTVVAVCVSARRGMPRPQVAEGELREGVGFVGNRHSVGGRREVCLFDQETYDALTGEGMAVHPGSFGENLTLRGIPFAEIKPGDHLKVGESAVIEITMVRKPCASLTPIDARLPEAVVGRSGWHGS